MVLDNHGHKLVMSVLEHSGPELYKMLVHEVGRILLPASVTKTGSSVIRTCIKLRKVHGEAGCEAVMEDFLGKLVLVSGPMALDMFGSKVNM